MLSAVIFTGIRNIAMRLIDWRRPLRTLRAPALFAFSLCSALFRAPLCARTLFSACLRALRALFSRAHVHARARAVQMKEGDCIVKLIIKYRKYGEAASAAASCFNRAQKQNGNAHI